MSVEKRIGWILAVVVSVASARGQISDTGGRDRPIPPSPPGSEGRGRLAADDWQRRLRSLDLDLRRGDWKAAHGKSQDVVREMFDRIIDGEGAAPLLAMAMLLRGVSSAGLGDRDAGLWDWYAAQSLFPAFRDTDLSPYGEVGKLFAEHRVGADGGWPAAAHAGQDPPAPPAGAESGGAPAGPPDVKPPKLLRKKEPAYPRAIARLCREGRVVVASVIEDSGAVSFPIVRQAGDSPVMTLSTLEALRDWRFEPARFEGKPVRVFYTLTVTYMAPACRRH